ncbi:hypothetical protein [Romboutsia lituseburensis]|uniref:Uncharacterized protein n=1 Tax=Romboutsia lituseburensis DSM 797 TaxID=1121325 RepID=A0A1G9NMR7_9FIRM|nr:hypothetical protein [Romboutsia lituseburensis]CEH33032.1 Hypothetical protein RLITU_0422 [Romboutsia lituseburensis]SDL87654.1 hypothetical protein SAMN04515677_1043 [Romboutsia lituseburensis DSM 797]
MYEVQMRYIDFEINKSPFSFRCEKFNIRNNYYRFENVFIDNFIISYLEVNDEDIALIKIN